MTAQVVLVGAPGSGKSTVGSLLARRLEVRFTDVDSVIEQRVGRSVADIFADDGEAVFRAFEESTTIELLDAAGVLALGGGAVLSPKIRSALRGHHVVWLQVAAGEAASRVGLNTARPLLLGNVRGRLISLLAQRRPLYAEVAVHEVATDDVPPEVVVDLIVERLDAGGAQGTSTERSPEPVEGRVFPEPVEGRVFPEPVEGRVFPEPVEGRVFPEPVEGRVFPEPVEGRVFPEPVEGRVFPEPVEGRVFPEPVEGRGEEDSS